MSSDSLGTGSGASGRRANHRPGAARRRRERELRRLPLGFVATTTAFLWLTTAIAAAALWPIYQSGQLVILGASTILLGTVIAILGARFRWSTLTVSLTTVLAYVVFGVPLAIPASTVYTVLPSLDGELELVRATALSWKQLLTITLPVGDYQSLLVPAFVLIVVTTVAGLSLGLRARWGELGVTLPVALFLVAILFGPETATWPLELSLGLLAAVLGWLVWRRWSRRRESIRLLASQALDADGRPLETVADHNFAGFRTVLGAGMIVVLAGGSAIAATLYLPPTAERQVLRTAIVQPFDPRAYPSPLSGFRHYEEPGEVSSTMLTVTGLPSGGRIRIATLDSYDGIVYSVGSERVASKSGSFTRVPSTFDQSALKGKRVEVRITVGDYSGVWLPTVGKFESVDFSGADGAELRDSFFYNNVSGTAAVVRGVGAGDSYSLNAIIPSQPSEKQLASLSPGSASVPRIAVVPDQLSSTLDAWVRTESSQGRRLAAMISSLRRTGYVSHGVSADDVPSRSGHAADRITELLTGQRMIGDQEQYAVTAAIMANQLGFPARVVYGFAPNGVNAEGPTEITGGDISAWIEVDTARFGWVTIDPTPPLREIPKEEPQQPTTIARPQSPVQPPPDEPQTRNAPLPPDSSQDNPNAENQFLLILFTVLRVLGWIALGVAILLAPFLTIVAAKFRRRRMRRHARSPILRISGGWQEFEDAVVDHGFMPPVSPTRSEVAATVGGVQPLVLASVADRAVFSPDEPGSDEADRLWRSVDDLRAAMGGGLTRWERVKAAISLRSLRGYSVKRLFRR